MKAIRMGAYGAASDQDVGKVAAVWRAAGFDAAAVADVAAVQWEKLICNVAYSAPCALTGMTVGEVMEDPDVGPVSRAAATEAFEVARALGIALGFDDPVAHVREFAGRMPLAKPSVLLDLEAGRPSEVGVINGAVVREAARTGLATPVNSALTGLVLALVATTTLMSVEDRIKEHAVLQTIGFSGRRVFGLVMTESVLLSLTGGVIGMGAALLTLEATNLSVGAEAVTVAFMPSMRLAITGLAVAISSGLLAGFAPALHASRTGIVSALRLS
jgi:hypothetical protein